MANSDSFADKKCNLNKFIVFLCIEVLFLIFIMVFTSVSNYNYIYVFKNIANVCIMTRPQQKSQFTVVCVLYGYGKFPFNDRITKLLTSLQNSMPLSDVYFLLSKNTIIEKDYKNEFGLHIYYEHVDSNVTRKDVRDMYNFHNSFWHWIFAYRYKFYQDFIESHKEIEHIIFLDDDTLILNEYYPVLDYILVLIRLR